MKRQYLLYAIILFALGSCTESTNNQKGDWSWETIKVNGDPVARHEAGLVAHKNKLYLIGGRRINPVSEFDTRTLTWKNKASSPIEIHHFQPVVVGDKIYIICAMTGEWPHEKPFDRIIIYDPEKDTFTFGDTIPANRRRGGAGAILYNDKIYVVGGITNGHMDGYQPWFDEYDPQTGEWKALADSPNARDHFQAAVNGDKLYAFSGRTTSKITNQDMALTVSHGNVYNFDKQEWEAVNDSLAIPTMRAGSFAFSYKNLIIVGGGETAEQVTAHNEVEAFNTKTKLWSKWPSLKQGRHGTGFAVIGDYVYVASGSGKHGGEPELTSIERLDLPK